MFSSHRYQVALRPLHGPSPSKGRRRVPVFYRADLTLLKGLTLTESKALLVIQSSVHLRGSSKIADSLLASECGMSRRSASTVKRSLERRGLVRPELVAWPSKNGLITSYDELEAPERGVQR